MNEWTFRKIVKRILEEEKKPLTKYEIWNIALKKGYSKLLDSKGKTPWNTLSADIYSDIKYNIHSEFVLIKEKPRKFSLKTLI